MSLGGRNPKEPPPATKKGWIALLPHRQLPRSPLQITGASGAVAIDGRPCNVIALGALIYIASAKGRNDDAEPLRH